MYMTMRTHTDRILLVITMLLIGALAMGCGNSSELDDSVSPMPTLSVLQSPPEIPNTLEPTAVEPPDYPVPSSSEVAVIGGRLVRHIEGREVGPLDGTTIYLAELLISEDGSVTLAALDETAAPSTLTDTNGYFIFEDLKPGRYAIVIKTPISLVLARDEITGEAAVLAVDAGEVFDAGTTHVDYRF